ncbi:GntR family transcriptional regulator [Mycolicibacterium fluoranthenivorans]|uniref:DNA-binding GntR family transcriptional regulator n=1 Tax=Mycolicibacterium fluoranthenivorans TaxID=258505 RepID=A0A7X5TVM2_9MYCO|nr:GntR family transcriptional regulator [Mycolicibacterium fluoranthenivorans]MCV7359339.1 GntR family transcriptional regulator [Mycolicibacterium fluoranthenivorans]NIH93572.1 DNA-binding GntR family transcriptional regulator [Mycolicibacterium fluoranthenivorans]
MSEGDSSGQRAYQATKDQILSGAVRGGQLLSEVEVAASLGVSRTPVHEAFLRLAAEDLLELLPRRGAVVVPVPPREATDLLEMRLALESAAVRRLCRHPDAVDALFTELTELITLQREGAAAGDEHRFAAADDAFHHRIVDVAGNAIGQRFYGSLRDRQRRMMAAAVRSDTARAARLIDEHALLADAIARRDLADFEALLLAHLQATYGVAL